MKIILKSTAAVMALASSQSLSAAALPDAHAPIGVMGDHIHKEGKWMASYRFMTMQMQQIHRGTDTVGSSMAGTGYMMSPREMTMDMHMVGVMYGATNKLTLGLMSNYQYKRMPMAGPTGAQTMVMKSSGIGDTSLSAYYQFHKTEKVNAHFGLGLSLPTGDTDKKVKAAPMPPAIGKDLPYPMQLGSGTFDLSPSITYNQRINDQWSWGAQAKATIHTDTNDQGYSLGDSVNVTTWVARNLNKNFALNSRVNFSSWSGIQGTQTNGLHSLNPVLSSPADPNNSGGNKIDLFVGLNYISDNGIRAAVEIGKTLRQDLSGTQLGSDWSANVGIQYAW